ncbi:hypothetical protein Taro_022943 [Colocasia esculenta]|uniref:Uncharacterized protein n=1 Tax=Colocasia esculenta TaxID=4460 RepID=A0A843V9V8_COLES|nr:hypothetical protein [Colocasia esculenta]
MLSRRLQRILAKKKKFQSGRRFFKRNKEFRKPEGKDLKKGEPICYECKKPRHIKAEYPKLKKSENKKKDNLRKFKKYKKKVMAAAWENSSNSDSESNSSSDEEEANLAFMANTEEKERVLELAGVVWRSSWWLGSRRSSTPSRSFSPLCLLRPTQTIILKSTKGDYEVQEEEQVEDGNASE